MEMKKCKEVATSSAAPSSPSNNSEEEEGSDNIKNSSFHAAKFSPRNASSKYDFVKVKVWLGDNADHYYVLSRFLLSRMLTVTKIPNHVAIKISLELKKLLIDNSLLDVSQSDLEANLFKLMERRGYGEEYINRYKMMTRFHHQRVPLVILVCGTACVGKSTLATQLAQRLNLPNVLQTDMVYELLRTSTDAPLTSTPVWARDFNSSEELIVEFCRECRIVRKGLAGDLKKAMKDGKPIIIEGIHLDPSIYLMDEGQKLPTDIPEKSKEPEPESVTSDDPARQVESNVSGSENHAEGSNCSSEPASEERLSDDQVNKALDCQKSSDASGSNCSSEPASEERLSDDQVNKALDCQKSSDASGSISEEKGKTVTNTEGVRKTSLRNEKGGAEPIIVPIVLDMAKFDHKALLEEWLSTRILGDNKWPVQDKDRLITNLKTIQDYLCSFKSQGGLTVVNISATTFPQTLDFLHGYLLQCIEQGISSGSSDNSKKPAET